MPTCNWLDNDFYYKEDFTYNRINTKEKDVLRKVQIKFVVQTENSWFTKTNLFNLFNNQKGSHFTVLMNRVF